MRTASRRVRVLVAARFPRVSLACVLIAMAGVLVLACGAPSPAGETAFPTPVVSSLATATITPVQITAAPSPQGTPPLPTSTRREASPLPTPTSTADAVSPVPTPTGPLPSTVTGEPVGEAVSTYTYRIVQAFPHDTAAYTQGLIFEDGVFYEGTGIYGQSTLRRVDPATGKVLQQHVLPPELFGEGITLWKDRIIQLTWKERIGLVYDKESFDQLDTFRYPDEGWGITHDGTKLIMSDGTSTLHFWDPETFEELGRVDVVDQSGPVTRLNELEYVEGLVYANVYQTDLIAMIEPDTGQIIGWIDLTGLLDAETPTGSGDVLNGIAYDEQERRLFVTGKRWPRLFEIELVPLDSGD